MADKILKKFQFFWGKIGIYGFSGSLIGALLLDLENSKLQIQYDGIFFFFNSNILRKK